MIVVVVPPSVEVVVVEVGSVVDVVVLLVVLLVLLVELVDDPRLKDAALRDADYRNEYPELVLPMLQEFTARFECWPLTHELQRRGVPAAPWSTVADVAANAHLNERGFFVDFEQPPCGRLRSAGPMFRASASPMRIRRPAPQPGEHQHEVLAEAVSWASSAPAPSVAGFSGDSPRLPNVLSYVCI